MKNGKYKSDERYRFVWIDARTKNTPRLIIIATDRDEPAHHKHHKLKTVLAKFIRFISDLLPE